MSETGYQLPVRDLIMDYPFTNLLAVNPRFPINKKAKIKCRLEPTSNN